MKRGKKIAIGVVLTVLVLGGAGAYLGYREFVGTESFDAAFYAAAAASTPAAPFSHADYAAALKAHVDDKGLVDYKGLKNDHGKLDSFLIAVARLKENTYDTWDKKRQMAFWINAYNALTLKAILDHYPIKAGLLSGLAYPRNSIRQIPGVWDKIQWLVMGEKMTLDHIEHQVLRAKFGEPRIHVALVCAAMGCPQLRDEPFEGSRLDKQLDDQAKGFVTSPAKLRIDRNARRVHLSSIFKWFGKDFVKAYSPAEGFGRHSEAERAVLAFAAKYLPAEDAAYLKAGNFSIAYLEYDWSLNERR